MTVIFEMDQGYEVLVPELHSFLQANQFKGIVERFGIMKKLKECKNYKNIPKNFQKIESEAGDYYFRKKNIKNKTCKTCNPSKR